jgi:hypothetical protein
MIYKIFAIIKFCNFYAPELYRDVHRAHARPHPGVTVRPETRVPQDLTPRPVDSLRHVNLSTPRSTRQLFRWLHGFRPGVDPEYGASDPCPYGRLFTPRAEKACSCLRDVM